MKEIRKTILLIDVGGSYTRAKIGYADHDHGLLSKSIFERSSAITDQQAFLDFVSELLNGIDKNARPQRAVVCFAGPVTQGTVSMLNWQEPRHVCVDDLVRLGLEREQIIFLNDMEAAAFGLLAHKKQLVELQTDPLYLPSSGQAGENENCVLLIPGTGIGVSAVIATNPVVAAEDGRVVACELQHTPIPVLDEQHEQVLFLMKQKLAMPRPSWEDFISGKGLENIYRCQVLMDNTGDNSGVELSATEIAARAINDEDARCHAALAMFYQCTGALAQLMALAIQPYGGIYLGGSSTRNNRGFIPDSPLLRQFLDNEVRNYLLKLFPFYLINDEINLLGNAYVAEKAQRKDQ